MLVILKSMDEFKVSVIIPVYNAGAFLRRAVESALAQPQTAEIILVEDGSPDNSWEVCQQLAREYPAVHLFRHPDGKNHGSGATRNEAIRKSHCAYIAFLDADDYYLPDRFESAEKLFASDPQLDGVYEAIGMHVEDEESLTRWKNANKSENSLHTMSKSVSPEDLFDVLIQGGTGNFSIVGMVVKRSVVERAGFFDENLPLHQDDAFIIKAAATCRLLPGRLDEPVAMWRVHDRNRISAPRSKRKTYKMLLQFWFTLWYWSRTHLSLERQNMLLQGLIKNAMRRPYFERPFPERISGLQKYVQLMILPVRYPSVVLQGFYWRSFSTLLTISSKKPLA